MVIGFAQSSPIPVQGSPVGDSRSGLGKAPVRRILHRFGLARSHDIHPPPTSLSEYAPKTGSAGGGHDGVNPEVMAEWIGRGRVPSPYQSCDEAGRTKHFHRLTLADPRHGTGSVITAALQQHTATPPLPMLNSDASTEAAPLPLHYT
ncbi:hypothetical protein Tdes44962_MAKER07399 [Teratosphaeria destructans]|uniref:Uncharacterized protein n=1 Tax=Teratosphaeria destructans TaxID=418781 RepID=A0A9W7W5Z8_9PEZI|nr:hypothetical protein Tdes44962_MAKER07399 [Teratosphaeria destructans]